MTNADSAAHNSMTVLELDKRRHSTDRVVESASKMLYMLASILDLLP